MRSSSRGSLSSRRVLPSACSASGLRRRRRLQCWCWESLSSCINKQSPPQQRFQQRDGLVLLTRKYIDPGKLVLEVGGRDDVARRRNQREHHISDHRPMWIELGTAPLLLRGRRCGRLNQLEIELAFAFDKEHTLRGRIAARRVPVVAA